MIDIKKPLQQVLDNVIKNYCAKMELHRFSNFRDFSGADIENAVLRKTCLEFRV